MSLFDAVSAWDEMSIHSLEESLFKKYPTLPHLLIHALFPLHQKQNLPNRIKALLFWLVRPPVAGVGCCVVERGDWHMGK